MSLCRLITEMRRAEREAEGCCEERHRVEGLNNAGISWNNTKVYLSIISTYQAPHITSAEAGGSVSSRPPNPAHNASTLMRTPTHVSPRTRQCLRHASGPLVLKDRRGGWGKRRRIG